MERYREIEKSIIKKYRKEIWGKFVKAVKDYELIKENDKIAVCLSGGKDSFLLAKCMEELLRHGKFHYELEYIVMNPGYEDENLKQIKENLDLLKIKAHIFETPIFGVVGESENACYRCAKMRRGYLYDYAKKLGCNKIALGHHFNDVVETIMMNMIYNGTYGSMMPKLYSDNFEGMELIRPLYLVQEKDIISWSKYNDLTFLDCACTVTKKNTGQRVVIKKLIEDLNKLYKDADKGIFNSSLNVNLDTVIGYKKGHDKISFLDEYRDKK
ncbi:MAG: ATP-binding protein [Bacilli bacterium]|nr:ATP-binding protein [Bacilli bacterium]MDD4809134.1 ATP-binding protein [Bacilli bacterium]